MNNIKKEVGDSLAALINEGLIEVSSIDKDGKFSYRLTKKGQKMDEAKLKEIDDIR